MENKSKNIIDTLFGEESSDSEEFKKSVKVSILPKQKKKSDKLNMFTRFKRKINSISQEPLGKQEEVCLIDQGDKLKLRMLFPYGSVGTQLTIGCELKIEELESQWNVKLSQFHSTSSTKALLSQVDFTDAKTNKFVSSLLEQSLFLAFNENSYCFALILSNVAKIGDYSQYFPELMVIVTRIEEEDLTQLIQTGLSLLKKKEECAEVGANLEEIANLAEEFRIVLEEKKQILACLNEAKRFRKDKMLGICKFGFTVNKSEGEKRVVEMEECGFCYEKQKEVCFLPCRHMFYCKDCYEKTKTNSKQTRSVLKCPICLSAVTKAIAANKPNK